MSIVRFALFAAFGALLLTRPVAVSAQASPPSPALRCAFAKQVTAVKRAAALLRCDRKALAAQTAVDPTCTAAAIARFETKFQKIEAKGGCMPAGDASLVGHVVDQSVKQLEQELQGACTPTGGPCVVGAPPCCSGRCAAFTDGGDPICSAF